jgi:hypothetical protein
MDWWNNEVIKITYLNHFIQPDSIAPEPSNSQDWDSYSYARNNPVKYTNSTRHCPEEAAACWARLRTHYQRVEMGTIMTEVLAKQE